MRHIKRVLIFLALVALSLPTLAAQDPFPVRLPKLDEVPAPQSASLASIEAQSGGPSDGLAFAIYRWDRFPSVIVFDTADFDVQDRMFSRLAFYLEKRGYRGRLLTDAQLVGRHGWNAHDYGPDGLAAFFSAAQVKRFPLDAEELLLRGLALREGLIVRGEPSSSNPASATEGAAFVPGSGAVLSISRSSNKYERILLLAHESYHGIYFCSEEYRALCESKWKAAPASERLFMTSLLGSLGYDTGSRALVVNEYQAYLLQQPRSAAPAYFERVGKLVADRAGVPAATEVLPALLKDEGALEAFLKSRFGVGAGGALLERRRGADGQGRTRRRGDPRRPRTGSGGLRSSPRLHLQPRRGRVRGRRAHADFDRLDLRRALLPNDPGRFSRQ